MMHQEFFQHAEGLRQAITAAIGLYLTSHQIAFSEEALIEEKGDDIEDLSKCALFYGAEVGVNPLTLAPANWPERHDGLGSIPYSDPTWQAFWATPES